MQNNEDWKTIVWRKLSLIFLDYPEFAFLLKIAGGIVLLIIGYFIIKLFFPTG